MSEKQEPTTSSRSMSFVGDSPAKTSAWQERAQDLTEPDRDCGQNTRALFASFDPDTSSWKTSQRCLVGGWVEFSETWPRAGMMQSGTAYRLPPSAPIIGGIASSLSPGHFPTPTAQRYGTGQNGQRGDGTTFKGKGSPSLDTMARYNLWPTPTARDWKDTGDPQKLAQYEHKKRLACSVAASDTSKPGSLSPTWVEWLQGFPIGWTDLDVSEMP